MIRSTFLTMILAWSGAVWAPIALAETDDSTPPSTSSEQAAAPYSDAELKSFAVALLEVDRIKTTYAPKLALTLRAQQEVKQAASQEMVQALKQQGMSVDKYQEMLINVQTNPALAGGVPAKVMRALTDQELAWKIEGTQSYQELVRRSLATMTETEALDAVDPGRKRIDLPELLPLSTLKAGTSTNSS